MKSLKSIGIAVAICFLSLFAMISSSDAEIEIIEMDTPSETYNDGWFYHHVQIETDIAYDVVDWYIGDPDDGDDLQYVGETVGDGSATCAWFYPDVSDCPGHIKGKKYRVGAKVWHYDDEEEMGWSDWETRDFTVFQSISTTEVENPPKKMKSISGYSKLTRQYYTGSSIAIDCYVNAYNPNNSKRYAWSRFKHSLTGRRIIVRDHPIGRDGIEPQRIGGDFGSYSRSDTLSHSDVNLDIDGKYTSGAYVRLIVTGNGEDNYLVVNTETFDSNDKPYDAPDE